ncbi:penicillin-insensitive murein endopeptidase [Rubellimicrobium aerolatum]|uniref:Penicillin-insensitive murein endopeptidase n=1 Tax=Rubellimicrobium aerolatum TaxID=490979 RepID=A0ABW0SH27_9RHOB|nr:penicillin-insensitive murein endopeptidase [Rubellimicrobium aerolatum]MBP1807706.1 penicillin-insensitive murein endopeptidase [Rubellimicrobium aerolatum]
MIRRPVKALALVLLLAACGGGPAAEETVTIPAAAGQVAKSAFGAQPLPSSQVPSPIGGYSRGCQAGAVRLPETGPTWQAMRLSRNRNWAQPVTVAFLRDLSVYAASLPGWSGLYIGDLSQPRGGPMTSGHASHQTGLDADIWMNPPSRLDLPTAERERISAIDVSRSDGARVNDRWSPQHEALLRHAAQDPRVARIFIFPGAKAEMCRTASGDRSWLRKIRPWWGHSAHFHVRLNCPPGATACAAQDTIPPGDGCAEAQAWVENILNPPPPDPDTPAAAPRRDLTLADLPGQCLGVLASR